MDVKVIREEQMEVRRGPWTMEEDFTLFNYIARHGEGRWNSLSRSAGLKRTGKSCRLRWLNYLRPDVRRGNITPEEQLLILELHSQWGNRWSKIAKHLPGRTDNEIKNYWRTRVQKHAKQIKCDVNSKQFKNTVRYLWMPTLIERIQAATSSITPGGDSLSSTITATTDHLDNHNMDSMCSRQVGLPPATFGSLPINQTFTPENSSTATSSNSFGAHVSLVSDLTNCFTFPVNQNLDEDYFQANQPGYGELLTSSYSYFNHGLDFQSMEPKDPWVNGGDLSESIRNVEDFWLLWHHLTNNI